MLVGGSEQFEVDQRFIPGVGIGSATMEFYAVTLFFPEVCSRDPQRDIITICGIYVVKWTSSIK